MLRFVDLLREHHAMIYSLACHALRDRAAAEDLTQEVFLALHEHIDTLESAAHAKAWLVRVAARRCIDEIRKRRYRAGPSLEVVEAASAPQQDELVLREQVRAMVARLPAQARTLLILRYQEGLAPAEIASLLELPVETVKSRLHRAVRLLRERLTRSLAGDRVGRKA